VQPHTAASICAPDKLNKSGLFLRHALMVRHTHSCKAVTTLRDVKVFLVLRYPSIRSRPRARCCLSGHRCGQWERVPQPNGDPPFKHSNRRDRPRSSNWTTDGAIPQRLGAGERAARSPPNAPPVEAGSIPRSRKTPRARTRGASESRPLRVPSSYYIRASPLPAAARVLCSQLTCAGL
jgi:hypothetical protein